MSGYSVIVLTKILAYSTEKQYLCTVIKGPSNMKATFEEVKSEFERRKGGPNNQSPISMLDLSVEMGWSKDEFKYVLMSREQTTTHVSKSPARNRRRAKRQAKMKEMYGL